MYYKLYIDVLFLENLILDYLLLGWTGRLLGCSTTQRRRILAAALGSGSFCVLCLCSATGTVTGLLITWLGIGVLMVKLGFHIRKWRQLLQAACVLYFNGLLLGGVISWLKEWSPVGQHSLVKLFVPIGIILEFFLFVFASVRKRKEIYCNVSIYYKGAVRTATGLWDTGNSLRDPLYHKPVSIIERRILEPEVDGEIMLFPVSYHSLGNTNGKLPALIADYLSFQLGDQRYVIEQPVLGLTEEPLSEDGSYDLILNPNITDSWRRK